MDATPSEWMDMSLWAHCRRLERPGYVFELENAEGLKLWTSCVEVVDVPFDWTSPPRRFRLVVEPPAERAGPMPKPLAPP